MWTGFIPTSRDYCAAGGTGFIIATDIKEKHRGKF
jgi:hypothetical protein